MRIEVSFPNCGVMVSRIAITEAKYEMQQMDGTELPCERIIVWSDITYPVNGQQT